MNAGSAGRVSALDLDELAVRLNVRADRLFRFDREQVGVASSMQCNRRFDAIVVCRDVGRDLDPAQRRRLIHNLVANLAPAGQVVIDDDVTFDVDARACGLELIGALDGSSLWRRVARRDIHDLVAEARQRIDRVTAQQLAAKLAQGDLVVLDTRTPTDRVRDGVLEGSVHAPRTVLEWLVDPASGYSLAAIESFETPIVVVCNEGYSSSLAAATLVDLGFTNVADLVGGVAAWRSAGLPLVPAIDHHQEELP